MGKKVLLTLTGHQRDDEGQENVTHLQAKADYYEKDGSHYILYEEKRADGNNTKNTIKLKDGLMELTKRGAINARMVFEKGQKHMMDYATPFGIIRLGVATTGVSSRQSKGALVIRADYCLTEENRVLFHCTILIKIQHMV